MASQTRRFGVIFTNIGWANGSYFVDADNNTYAGANYADGATDTLIAKIGTGNEFTIPTGATIDGIEIKIKHLEGAAGDEHYWRLTSTSYTDYTSAYYMRGYTTAAEQTWGSPTNTLGCTATVAQINSDLLAIRDEALYITGKHSEIRAYYADITIYYTESTITKSVSDTVTLTDSLKLNKGLIVTDSVALSDSVSISKGLVIADGITLSDAFFAHKTVSLLDAITLFDSIDVTLGEVEPTEIFVTDAINLVDSLMVHKGLTLSEAIVLTDAVLRHKDIELPDGITLTDLISKIGDQTSADAVGVFDMAYVHKELIFNDELGLFDEVYIHKTILVTDSFGVDDEPLVHKTVLIEDSFGADDAILVHKTVIITDSLGAADVATIGAPGNVELTDNIHIADSVLVHKTLIIDDSFGVEEEVLTHRTILIEDSLGADDSILAHKHLIISDALGADDSATAPYKELCIEDALTLLDAITIFAEGIKSVTDELGLSEEVLVHKNLMLQDILGLAEQVLVHKEVKLVDTMSLVDEVLVHKHIMITDSLGAEDALPLLMKNLTVEDVISLLDEVYITELESLVEVDDILGLLEEVLIHKHVIITDSLHITDMVRVTKPATYASTWGLRGLVGQLIKDRYSIGSTPVVIWDEEVGEVQAFLPIIKVYQPRSTAEMIGLGYGHMKVKHSLVVDVRGRLNQGTYNAKEEVLRILGAYRLSPFSGYTMMEFDDGTQHAGYSGFYWWTINLTVWQIRRPVGSE